jgi:hypothetical protein
MIWSVAPVSAPLKAWSGEPGSTLIETSAPVSFWLLEIASRWRANL